MHVATWRIKRHAFRYRITGRLRSPTGSAVGHISTTSAFKPRPGLLRRVFLLSLRLITFGGRSVHLAYIVHRSDRKQQHVFDRNGGGVLICPKILFPDIYAEIWYRNSLLSFMLPSYKFCSYLFLTNRCLNQ